MSDTTTIEVRADQAEQLRKIQRENGNYKTAIDQLLEAWESESETIDSDKLAVQVAERIDYAHLAERVSEQVVREMVDRS
jgi:hypothetical protein